MSEMVATIDSASGVMPTGRSRAYIDQLAGQIARKLGFGPGGNIAEVVERLGGRIQVRSWKQPPEDGSIHVRGERDFIIFLSPFTGEIRNRFTIAHELGHYFLHSKVGKEPLVINREGSNRAEWEANWFAAGFLMPEVEFRNAWELRGHRIEAVAAEFGVSTQAAQIRVETLGL